MKVIIDEKILDNLIAENTQLKQQLAEKQNTIDEINKEFVQAIHELCAEKYKDIEKIKQQLDEKDEQINNLEQMCQICNKEQENELLKQQLAEKDKKIELLNAMISTLPEHDKEIKEYELEKVKAWVTEHTQDFWTCENDDLDTDLYDYIDQQIKELKGQHND